MTIVLIGPPAAGKSRSGRRLARALGARFADTDSLIQVEHGPIRELFTTRGEAAFREIERDTVRRAIEEYDVVALGGGAVMQPATREVIVASGAVVVYLTVQPEAVAARINNDKRPLITGLDSWIAIVEQRRSVYETLATLTFDTSFRPMRRVVEEIIEELLERGVVQPTQVLPGARQSASSEHAARVTAIARRRAIDRIRSASAARAERRAQNSIMNDGHRESLAPEGAAPSPAAPPQPQPVSGPAPADEPRLPADRASGTESEGRPQPSRPTPADIARAGRLTSASLRRIPIRDAHTGPPRHRHDTR